MCVRACVFVCMCACACGGVEACGPVATNNQQWSYFTKWAMGMLSAIDAGSNKETNGNRPMLVAMLYDDFCEHSRN